MGLLGMHASNMEPTLVQLQVICNMGDGYLEAPVPSLDGTFTCEKFDRFSAIHRKLYTYITTVTQERDELA